MKFVLAIDVAKNKSMVSLFANNGYAWIEPYEINHSLCDFQNLIERVRDFDVADNEVTIFMESTSTYHYPVKRFFREETNCEVMVINPLHSSAHKRNLRKTKTDKQDCYNLADLFFTGKIKNYNDHEQYYLDLNVLARQYDFLIFNNVRFKNRYKMLINLSFPEYEFLFKGQLIYSDTALSFIEKYSHPDIIKETRIDALANFMAKLNGRHEGHYLRKANLIKESAKTSYPSVSKNDDIVSNLILTTRMLKYQIKEIENLREIIITKARECYLFETVNSIFGFGELTTALVIAELKDIARVNYPAASSRGIKLLQL